MDEAKHDLVNQLTARAGMLLEDASGPLILLQAKPDEEIGSMLASALGGIERASDLIKAAQSIAE